MEANVDNKCEFKNPNLRSSELTNGLLRCGQRALL